MRSSWRHIRHGMRRRWWKPWSPICRCGLEAWPCYVVVMLDRQASYRRPAANERPVWNGPTVNVLAAPLLTRGQAARSRGRARW